MAKKPGIPKGTRDFNPEQVSKRNYIINTIKTSFERFGFQPIETPSFENSETLLGKYGDEGDRLIFKILNSGDYYKDVRNRIAHSSSFSIYFYEIFDSITNLKIEHNSDYENYIVKACEVYEDLSNTEKELIISFFNEKKEEIIHLQKKTPNNEVELTDSFSLKRRLVTDLFMKYISNIEILNSTLGTKLISEKALRYDLTVPFARYVVQYQNDITFPFKRYQIQPVWRADRPQKGRFREFYQCDADVVGSKSLWQEIEFIQLYDDVFKGLNLEGVTIKINNRKILAGIADIIGAKDKLIDFTVALDKLDKIGEEKVKEEMISKGIPLSGIEKLDPLFKISGSFSDQIKTLRSILKSSQEGIKGIEELEFINSAISELKLTNSTLEMDVTLARGLNYYTGAIFEVSAPKNVDMGSIGGGGRYDDLTGIFGLKDVSGVGISFGLDRIYLVLEELNLFPETVMHNTKVLFINFGDQEALYSLIAIKQLRENGINSELYPDSAKMKKQMTYANKRDIKYVVLVGANEVANNKFTLKDMDSGEQKELTLDQLKNALSKKL